VLQKKISKKLIKIFKRLIGIFIMSSEFNNLYNDLINIVDWNIEKLVNYDTNKILNCNNSLKELLISNLSFKIVNVDSYKYMKYKRLFEFIIKIMLLCDVNLYNCIGFIQKLSCFNKGQFLLEKIKNKINFDRETIMDILFIVAAQGTLPIYFFWQKRIDEITESEHEKLLLNSLKNNDERIFEYLVKKQKISDKIEIFCPLFISGHSKKIIYKKIKLLSNYIDISKKFDKLLSNGSINTFFDLEKYYYKYEFDYKTLYLLYSKYILSYLKNDDELTNFYDKLKTNNEKNCLLIISSIVSYEKFINKNIKGNIDSVLSANYEIIIQNLFSYDDILIKSELIMYIYKYFSTNKYFNKFLESKEHVPYTRAFSYTRFYVHYPLYELNLKYNKCLHYLRLYAKKKININKNIKKLTYQPLISELKNYKPNRKINVLNKGSLNYQYQKVKFTKIPPRCIIPYELNFLSQCLIKEKSDGILVNTLPINIFPNCEEFKNYCIKAEYIEEHNLYLVFDIDIPNTTIIERQNYLRILHPYTSSLNNFQIINTFEDLKASINYERFHISKFIEFMDTELNNELKWYPKASFKINNLNDNFVKEINNFIEEVNPNKNNFFINEGIIKNDGFIITPYNEVQELKIKPKSLLTIDLLYNGKNWKDSNNKVWLNIKTIPEINYKVNKIYRCYPCINNSLLTFYIPKEIRYDKKLPNNNKICTLLQHLFEYDWNKRVDYNNIYYKLNINKSIDTNLYKLLEYNKSITINLINTFCNQYNKNWLDLGCGKCKFFENIKLYNPNTYLGIDSDINCIIKANSKYNNIENIKLYLCDLNNNWDITDYKINSFNWTVKYDYIICNFSLMHFCSDFFWEQLDKVVKNNTIFIFNIVKENVNWNYKNNYLKSTNEKCNIYFSWVHNEKQSENIIKNELLNEYFLKYNWEVLNIFNTNNNNLAECYSWYIIKKQLE